MEYSHGAIRLEKLYPEDKKNPTRPLQTAEYTLKLSMISLAMSAVSLNNHVKNVTEQHKV